MTAQSEPMRAEYRSTCGAYAHWSWQSAKPLADDPVRPDGDGWQLVTACMANGIILWFWRREAP